MFEVKTYEASLKEEWNCFVENAKNSTYDISVKLSIPSNLELDKVLSQLRVLRNVVKVNRS